MDYSQSKQTTKQWHYCQQETEEPVSSQYATKLTCSNNCANRGYRPNHDVAPCRIGSLDDSQRCKQRVRKWASRSTQTRTHVSLKENWNRTPKTENNQLPHLPKPVPFLQSDVFLGQRASERSSFPVCEQPLARLQGIKLVACINLLAPKHSWGGSHQSVNKQGDFMLFRARKARWGVGETRLRQRSLAAYDWVDLRCVYASENRGKIRRGKNRRKMSSVGWASGNFGVGHPKFQPGTFVPGSRFANRASFDANRAVCPVCPVLEWPLSPSPNLLSSPFEKTTHGIEQKKKEKTRLRTVRRCQVALAKLSFVLEKARKSVLREMSIHTFLAWNWKRH